MDVNASNGRIECMNSSRNQNFEKLIEALGLAQSDLILDEFNACTVAVDDQEVSFQIKEDEDFIMYATVRILESSPKVKILERLLQANLFWIGTSGNTLSYQPDDKAILLLKRIYADGLSSMQMQGTIENFLGVLRFWQKEVEKEEEQEKEEAEAPFASNTRFRV